MNTETQSPETFEKPDTTSWIKAASAEIKGADPMVTLKWSIEEGIDCEPYYSQEDLEQLAYLQQFQLPPTANFNAAAWSWQNMPGISIHGEAKANEIALEHLQQEAEGILFSSVSSAINFNALLEGVAWEHCAISFIASKTFPIQALEVYLETRTPDSQSPTSAVFWNDLPTEKVNLKNNSSCKKLGLFIPPSSPTTEIAEALTLAVKVIEHYREKGETADAVIKQIAFSLPVGPQLLTEISKLKALRMLWYQITQAYHVKDYTLNTLYLHGRSEPWINEKFQPHGNLLKSTIAALAAISGGCNAVTIYPEQENNVTTTRIARNTTAILRMESHFDKVADPFAGAYSLEVMIDKLAAEAWKKFQSSLD